MDQKFPTTTSRLFAACQLCLLAFGNGSAQTYHAAVDSFWTNPDPFIQRTVLPNIEKNRKSDVILKFVSADGAAIPGLQVQANMIKHRFLFGCLIPPSAADSLNLNPLWLDVFNYGLSEGAGKWSNLERSQGVWDFTHLDSTVAWCERNGITYEEHFLSGYYPAWAAHGDTVNGKDWFRAQQLLHIRKVIERYGKRIPFYQVDNESKLSQLSAWDSLKISYPDMANRFGISNSIAGHGGWDYQGVWTMPAAQVVSAQWPGLAYAANQCHSYGTWMSPAMMYTGMFDKYAGSNIKLHLTEFDYRLADTIKGGYRHGKMTEDLKAIYYVQLAASAFSHPSVEGINFWCWYKSNYQPGSDLIDDNGNPLPAYYALKSLIKDKLWTRTSGQSNAQGIFNFRGFHGKYQIRATAPNGLAITDTVDIGPSLLPIQLTLGNRGTALLAPKKAFRPNAAPYPLINIQGKRLKPGKLATSPAIRFLFPNPKPFQEK